MYHDDPYDPTLETNYDVPGYAASEYSDATSVTSRVKRNRQMAEELTNEDKGYCKVKRNKIQGNPNSSFVEIDLYSGSDNLGSKIRGAITGSKYGEFKVGSKDEYLFFKVCIATGEKGLRGNKTFFFDNPEQYEKHMRCVVDHNVKSAWADRNIKELLRRKQQQ